MRFFDYIRQLVAGARKRFFIDLSTLEEITPAAALTLLSELDRWRERTPGERLVSVQVAKWSPIVRRRLKEMGFFQVLKASCPHDDRADDGEDRYVPFLSGMKSDGESARQLRLSIEAVGPALRDRDALYDGLIEAMTNVRHHAYPVNAGVRRWWTSASVNSDRSRLTVMFLDHGVGIPATLPRSEIWEEVRGFLSKLGIGNLRDDAKLIEAAVSVERSRTTEEHRGHGLRQDILGYIESHGVVGRLRVISNRGLYTYERLENGEVRTRTRSLRNKFRGTFLEWIVQDYGLQEKRASL